MKKKLINSLISLLLLFSLLLSASFLLIACSEPDDKDSDPSGDEGGEDDGGKDGEDDKEENYLDKIVVPPLKTYDRDTVKFSDMTYSRPNIEAICEKLGAVVDAIEENKITPEEQLKKITDIEPDYSTALTMRSLATVYSYKDTYSQFWGDESEYIATAFPDLAKAIEDMMVAAAKSANAKYFEDNYFGEGFVDAYKDGGSYTEELVLLLKSEASYEADFTSLSPATIKITFQGVTDTFENFIKEAVDRYGENSVEHLRCYSACFELYKEKYNDLSKELYIELIKVRKSIATEMGDDNYLAYAYETMGHEYTPEEISNLIDDIAYYMVGIFSAKHSTEASLAYHWYNNYFRENTAITQTFDKLVNGGYSALEKTDDELFEIYQYMLQFSLFDIDKATVSRFEGSFTTYIENYEAPFLFVTAGGYTTDYLTLFHEFGHFADYYMNGNSTASLALLEVYSQGLELLMTTKLEGVVSDEQKQYLMNKSLCSAMETIMYQAFYARVEELVYKLPAGSINEAEINKQVARAANEFELPFTTITEILIPHIVTEPTYVQSYAVSMIPAVEMYLMETDDEGAGFAAYKTLLSRGGKKISFTDALEAASLTSSFKSGYMKELANDIYYTVKGCYYYENSGSNAA